MSMKRVYRRIWIIFITGVVLFFAILALGGLPYGKSSLDLHSPYALLLVLPITVFVYGVWTSMRYWRCEYCGAPLPTENETYCRRCGRKIDLS